MAIEKSDITWLAGFIDGEGCFYFPKSQGAPRIQVAQKDPWPLLKIQSLVGGRLYRFKGSSKPSESYNLLMITGKHAIGLMMTLYPILSPRRQTKIAEIIGRWRAVPLRGKCNLKTHCIRGHEFTPENTYRKPKGTGRECKACIAIHHEKHRLKLLTA